MGEQSPSLLTLQICHRGTAGNSREDEGGDVHLSQRRQGLAQEESV